MTALRLIVDSSLQVRVPLRYTPHADCDDRLS